jgi:hypothetical protein
MNDHPQSTAWADVTHAVLVHATGACRAAGMTAPDGGPLYVLTLIGQCRCGREDDTDIEQSVLLRAVDLVNVIAALTDVARGTGLGDTLADRVEAVIEATRERLGTETTGQLVITCTACAQRAEDCRCRAWDARHA